MEQSGLSYFDLMTAEQLLKESRLDEALKSLQIAVRDDPANAKLRVFLFQLLSIVGDWKRALTQLHVLAEMDSDSMMLARVFEPVLHCEAFRNDVFAGKRTPIIFGQPPEWIGYLIQAMEYFGKNEFQAGIEQRDKAFDLAPPSSGKLNGQSFEWIADADERLGPVLEVILDGKYYWVPFCRIKRIFTQPVSDLRDLVWTPAQFMWENGGEASGHIPTRYPGSETEAEGKLRLAQKTEWREINGVQIGLGQRLLASDADEYPLLEIRTLEIAPFTSASPNKEPSRSAEVSSDI